MSYVYLGLGVNNISLSYMLQHVRYVRYVRYVTSTVSSSSLSCALIGRLLTCWPRRLLSTHTCRPRPTHRPLDRSSSCLYPVLRPIFSLATSTVTSSYACNVIPNVVSEHSCRLVIRLTIRHFGPPTTRSKPTHPITNSSHTNTSHYQLISLIIT